MMQSSKLVFYKYLYKIGIIQIGLFLLSVDGYSQTHISPQVGIAFNTISNDFERQTIGRTGYLQDMEESFLIGLQVSHSLNNRFEVYLNGRFERLEAIPSPFTELGEREDGTTISIFNEFTPGGIVFRRFHFGLGFGYEFVPKLTFISSLSLVRIASTKRRQKKGLQHILDDRVLKSGELESYFELSLRYQFKSISIAPYYRNGFWHNDGFAPDQIDPVSTVGLRIGYRFKVLDKIKQSSKVVCPKL